MNMSTLCELGLVREGILGEIKTMYIRMHIEYCVIWDNANEILSKLGQCELVYYLYWDTVKGILCKIGTRYTVNKNVSLDVKAVNVVA